MTGILLKIETVYPSSTGAKERIQMRRAVCIMHNHLMN